MPYKCAICNYPVIPRDFLCDHKHCIIMMLHKFDLVKSYDEYSQKMDGLITRIRELEANECSCDSEIAHLEERIDAIAYRLDLIKGLI